VVSGPILLVRGERIAKLPFLHPLESEAEARDASSDTAEENDRDQSRDATPLR
jgi:hypothetical protein